MGYTSDCWGRVSLWKQQRVAVCKTVFAGGNNSLRGFRSRTIGPGSYRSPNAGNSSALFLADQSGDIKLEMNVEYRRKLLVSSKVLYLQMQAMYGW